MRIKLGRTLVAALALSLMAACGGGGGGSTPPPSTPTPTPVPATGGLTVTIASLPAGAAAAVKVTGPANYTQSLSATQTLTGLAAGNYSVTADSVASGTLGYTPAPAAQTIAVVGGATAAVTVTYANVPVALSLQEVTSVSAAVFLTAPAGDRRQFIVERTGRIRVMQDGALLPAPFLDISARVAANGEGGLLSMAFHPQYASNGFFYLYYTDAANDIVIERRQVSANANVADPSALLEIFRIPHPNYTNHFGGQLAFGPDGFLYFATGDGGGGGDPQRNAQNYLSLLGKMLRIDVANTSGAQRYSIPTSNPYAGMSSRRNEIWAVGLRNPWRFSFDGDQLYIADVGQGWREEVNIAGVSQAGLNYGWNTMEGSGCYNAASCNQTGLTLPAFEYEHGQGDVNGCSITGGYVYRGKALPELAGRYFYSDYCGAFLKSFLRSGSTIGEPTKWPVADIGNVVSFGQDGDGELYMISENGKIFKIVRLVPL